MGDDVSGGPHSADDLLPLVYEQLRQLARQRMAQEQKSHTLQATALVHEAYLRIVGANGAKTEFVSEAHFYHAAAQAMRRILIEHARSKGATKRGGESFRLNLTSVLDLATVPDSSEILAFDDAISRLEEETPEAGVVVRLRFYAGLSIEETAAAMGVSARTVNREWTYARAWLYRELSSPEQARDAGLPEYPEEPST